MKIKLYRHDDSNKRELFSVVGEACVSIDVRNAIGNPITSSPGDTWLVAMDGDSLCGFCILSFLKSGNANLHGFYVAETALAVTVDARLREAAEKEAGKQGSHEIRTIDFERRRLVYETRRWSVAGQRGKQFLLYTKQIKGD